MPAKYLNHKYDDYPFGMAIPGHNYSAGYEYRYGFNGQEKDDEVTDVTGATNTAMFWEYDTRLGRRWNLDPIVKVWESPYATFASNPIYYADPNGLDKEDKVRHDIANDITTYIEDENGKDLIVHEYGHWDEKGTGFIQDYGNVVEGDMPVGNAANQNIQNTPESIYIPTAQQKAWYALADAGPKALAVGLSLPLTGPLAAEILIEELAGVPIYSMLGGGAAKTLIKQEEKQLVNTFQLNDINSFAGASVNDAKNFLQSEGWQIISIKKGKPGFRAINPQNSSDVITVIQGNAEKIMHGSSIPKVKQGNYLKRSTVKDVRVPLEGNPALNH